MDGSICVASRISFDLYSHIWCRVHTYWWIMMMRGPWPRVYLKETLYMDGDGLSESEARQAIQWPYGMGYLWYRTFGLIWINEVNGILWVDYLWSNGHVDGSDIMAQMMMRDGLDGWTTFVWNCKPFSCKGSPAGHRLCLWFLELGNDIHSVEESSHKLNTYDRG